MNRIAKLAGGVAAAASAVGLRRARRQARSQIPRASDGGPGGSVASGFRSPEDLAAERLKQRLDESRERLKAQIPPQE